MQKLRSKLVVATIVGAMALVIGSPSAQEKKLKAIDLTGVDLSKAEIIGLGIGSSLAALDKRAGAQVAAPQGGAYGFQAGGSPEKGSFRLGLLLADFQAAAQAGNLVRAKETAAALLSGLTQLDAPEPLMQSASNLVSAVHRGVNLEAIAQLARPLLEPYIKAFVQDQGRLNYFYLGEWAETVRLAAAVGTTEGGTTPAPIGLIARAGLFSKEMAAVANIPPGVVRALDDMKQIAAAENIGPHELQKVLAASETLISLMG